MYNNFANNDKVVDTKDIDIQHNVDVKGFQFKSVGIKGVDIKGVDISAIDASAVGLPIRLGDCPP